MAIESMGAGRRALVCGAALALAGAVLLVGARVAGAGLASFEVEMTAAELQARLDAMAPIKVEKSMATLALVAPRIELASGADRLVFESPVEVSVQGFGSRKAEGRAKVSGALRYEPSEGAFYLDAPEVVEFEIKGLPERHRERARSLAQLAAQKAAAARPVYVLRDDSVKQKLARAALKSVQVRNGKLVATLGI